MTATPIPDPRRLQNVRLNYFVRYGALAFLLPFINLFFKRQGLSGTEIGLLGTMVAVASLIAAPIWGRLNDTTHRPRQLLQLAMALTSLFIYLLGRQSVFGWMALLLALHATASAGIDPLFDMLAVAVTRGGAYGSIRLFGSLGWAVTVVLVGWLIEQTDISVIFAGYVTLMVAAALLLYAVHFDTTDQHSRDKIPLRQVITALGKDRPMLGLLTSLAFVGLALIGWQTFEPIFLDELGAGETLIGLGYTITALAEPPAMLWADRYVRTRSAGGLLRLGLLLAVSRAALVLLFPVVPVIVGSRIIEGVAFGFRQVAVVVFVTRNAPGKQAAMMLALYTITLRGLMQIVGAPLAGLAYDAVGAYWLYAVALAGQAIAWAILLLSIPAQVEKPVLEDAA